MLCVGDECVFSRIEECWKMVKRGIPELDKDQKLVMKRSRSRGRLDKKEHSKKARKRDGKDRKEKYSSEHGMPSSYHG